MEAPAAKMEQPALKWLKFRGAARMPLRFGAGAPTMNQRVNGGHSRYFRVPPQKGATLLSLVSSFYAPICACYSLETSHS
jgi:hypothetical protein